MLKHRDTFDREHRALLEALENRNTERAAALLSAHLAGASEHLVAELDAEAAAGPPATVAGSAPTR
jgi:DNA-binding GntR family transcriptional regulator